MQTDSPMYSLVVVQHIVQYSLSMANASAHLAKVCQACFALAIAKSYVALLEYWLGVAELVHLAVCLVGVLITYFNFEYSFDFRPFEAELVVVQDRLDDLCCLFMLHHFVNSRNWIEFDLTCPQVVVVL